MKIKLRYLLILISCFILAGCMTNSKRYEANRGLFHVAEWKGDCRISFVSNSNNYDYAVIDESTYQSFLKVVSDLESRSCNKKEIMFSSAFGGSNCRRVQYAAASADALKFVGSYKTPKS